MRQKSEFSKGAIEAMAKGIEPVYKYYFQGNNKTLIKASDFYVPWFFGKKQRLEEFETHYTPMSMAAFLCAVKHKTQEMFGEPNEALIELLKKKHLPARSYKEFNEYWDVIQKADEDQENKDPKDLVKKITVIFLNKIFGPQTQYPNPDYINSDRLRMALGFQIGNHMYSMNFGVTKVFERLAQEGRIPPARPGYKYSRPAEKK